MHENGPGGSRACYHLAMRKISIPAIIASLLLASSLGACSPKYNWRDYQSPDATYRVMFPEKPATYTRSIDLDGLKVDMTMAAAEVDGAVYAVGAAQAPDAQAAQAALGAMQTALVRNIGGRISSEKVSAGATASGEGATQAASSEVVADGVVNGVPMRLVGRFEARGNRIYQVIVMGPAKAFVPEQTDQFLSSFKLQR